MINSMIDNNYPVCPDPLRVENLPLYADNWQWFRRHVPDFVLYNRGGDCPFEATGEMFGHKFYYRDRHGYAELRLGRSMNDLILTPDYQVSIESPEFMGGNYFWQNLITMIPSLTWSDFPYRFTDPLQKDKDYHWITSWGQSAEEAYDKLLTHNPFDSDKDSKNYALWNQQLEEWNKIGIDPAPLNNDNRIKIEVDFVLKNENKLPDYQNSSSDSITTMKELFELPLGATVMENGDRRMWVKTGIETRNEYMHQWLVIDLALPFNYENATVHKAYNPGSMQLPARLMSK